MQIIISNRTHITLFHMEGKNHFFNKTVKYLLLFCLYYNYVVLAIFYYIYIKAWYNLEIRPDLSGMDPKEIGFNNTLLDRTSNLLPYIWIIITFYFLIYYISNSKITNINKKHHNMFYTSIFLFILTIPLLVWYAD